MKRNARIGSMALLCLGISTLSPIVYADSTEPQRSLPRTGEAEIPPMPKKPPFYSPWFGGTGGSINILECRSPGGRYNYIASIFTDVGRFVQGMALGCMDSDGNWVGTTLPVGGTWTYPMDTKCPMGSFPYGIHGRVGTYVDSLGLLCTSNGLDRTGMTTDRGGSGGTRFEWTCPEHYSLAGFNIRAGDVIDAVQVYCRYDPPKSP